MSASKSAKAQRKPIDSTSARATARPLGPWAALAFLAFSLLGLVSSALLLDSELTVLRTPGAELDCDVNPLIGCSSSLLSPQAHLLGLPNSAIGLAAFGALIALAFVIALGGALPRLIWGGLAAGALLGLVFVSYFVFQSVVEFRTLCPYCMLTWVAALGILPLALGGAAASGAFGEGLRSLGRSTVRYSWAVALLLYLLIVLVIVVALPDKIGFLF